MFSSEGEMQGIFGVGSTLDNAKVLSDVLPAPSSSPSRAHASIKKHTWPAFKNAGRGLRYVDQTSGQCLRRLEVCFAPVQGKTLYAGELPAVCHPCPPLPACLRCCGILLGVTVLGSAVGVVVEDLIADSARWAQTALHTAHDSACQFSDSAKQGLSAAGN